MTPLLTTRAAAQLLSLDQRTLERYRIAGCGPRFVKMEQCVRYRVEDLQAWLAARTVSSTSEEPKTLHKARAKIESQPSGEAA